ncbi:DUF397 domain-containing protein [Streptomyces peucetius]|uniref:DUF397 domain-containing protein n=1 Tax=Streptomyces peucetius TaxID=1950 RepID=A0ABY6IA67_STRPE|nr:DUF397 domain-containing protein [Streptomyces peucetius]UYQ63901.1 DUF397 domain-containing protein [Streptomyces peucetius]
MIRKTASGDDSSLEGHKSSYSSNSSDADCVEVATTPDAVLVRDSKNVPGPRLFVTSAT